MNERSFTHEETASAGPLLRSTRKVSIGIVGAILGAVSVCLFGSAPEPTKQVPKSIQAEEIVLLDKKSRTRIRLGMTDECPQVTMYDVDGKRQIELGFYQRSSGGDRAPGIKLYNQDGNGVGSFFVDQFGRPGLILDDNESKTLLHLEHHQLSVLKNQRDILWKAR